MVPPLLRGSRRPAGLDLVSNLSVEHQMSEAVPSIVAQSWSLGSQVAGKKNKRTSVSNFTDKQCLSNSNIKTMH